LVVYLHVLDVERDVLLGLPLDLLLQFGLRHHRHGDFSDDHALPGDAQGALLLADFGVVEDLL